MKAPDYVWVCHRCGKSNEPRTSICASCGFSAIASAAEINPETEEDKARKRARDADIASKIWLFFPEGPIAGGLFIYSPVWAIKLLAQNHFVAAVCLAILVLACGYGFSLAVKKQSKYGAYASIASLIAGAVIIHSVLQP